MNNEDIIHQLPDSLCNQIAAGEVILNPASVVKELLENSIDAKSDEITLIIIDGGKTLIQVIDNGIGMSENDVVMSLKKHSTSKIKDINDLYSINTMGFRGEAIASIISVAQVEIITKTKNSKIGTKLIVEDSKIISQENINCNNGTIFTVKNLFFNTPVRRTFLKSNNIEFNLILKEFQHIALSYPHISLKLINNDVVKYDLKKTNLLQRITDLFNDKNKNNLIPFNEENEFVNISGFLLNPSKVKKKEDNFIFVNNRFIRNYNIKKNIIDSYKNTISNDKIPFFVIFLDINPRDIDVNINPSKTDVKFKNEDFIFSLINKVVKKSLFYFEIPNLDFENNNKKYDLSDIFEEYNKTTYQNEVKESLNFEDLKGNQDLFEYKNSDENTNKINFTKNYDTVKIKDDNIKHINKTRKNNTESDIKYFIINDEYLISTVKSGLLVINIQRAINRITYDNIYKRLENESIQSQQLLFPQDIFLSKEQIILLDNKYAILKKLGFNIIFCNNSIKITGLPDFIDLDNITNYIDEILFYITEDDENAIYDKIIQTIIRLNIYNFKKNIEINNIINSLFICKNNVYDPFGKKIFTILDSMFLQDILDD